MCDCILFSEPLNSSKDSLTFQRVGLTDSTEFSIDLTYFLYKEWQIFN